MRRLIILALDVFSLYRASRGRTRPTTGQTHRGPRQVAAASKTGGQQQNEAKARNRSRKHSDSTCQRGSHRYRNGPDIVRGSRQGR